MVLMHKSEPIVREVWPIIQQIAAELGVGALNMRWNNRLSAGANSPSILFMDGSRLVKTIPVKDVGSGDTLMSDWRRTMGSSQVWAVRERQKFSRQAALDRPDEYLLEGDVFTFDLGAPKPPEDDYLLLG